MFANPWLPTPCSAQLFRERSSNSEDCPWIWTFCRQQLFWWPSTSKIEQLEDDFLQGFQMCSSHPNTNRTPDLKTCYFMKHMKNNNKHKQLDARGNCCWHRCVVCVWAMKGEVPHVCTQSRQIHCICQRSPPEVCIYIRTNTYKYIQM